MDTVKVNERIRIFEELIETRGRNPFEGNLYTGVDLGTASMVLCVVDEKGTLVAGAFQRCQAVRDGIVVDFVGAVAMLRKLKKEVEDILEVPLLYAAGAIPPGVTDGSEKIVRNVLEAAGFQVTTIVDEPTAAAKVLGIKEGAVVDIGGGTTGISVLKNGEVLSTYDEATGGHHMNLVIAGNYRMDYEAAEKLKCAPDRQKEVFPVVLPVIDKMAAIVKQFLTGKDVSRVYLVGGGSTLDGFEAHFEKTLGIPAVKPYDPMLVTPMGIALCAQIESR